MMYNTIVGIPTVLNHTIHVPKCQGRHFEDLLKMVSPQEVSFVKRRKMRRSVKICRKNDRRYGRIFLKFRGR